MGSLAPPRRPGRGRSPRPAARSLAAALLLFGLPLEASRAESALRFRAPDPGSRNVAIFDEDRRGIGSSRMSAAWLRNGGASLEMRTRLDSGRRVEIDALLERVEDTPGGPVFRPLWQRMRRFEADGSMAMAMRVDHVTGRAFCFREGRREVVRLDEQDRVANVAIVALLEPLARSEVDRVAFQLLLCRAGGRIVDVYFERTKRFDATEALHGVVQLEVRYALAGFLARLLSPFLPELVFWYAPAEKSPWVGHRLALFPDEEPRFTLRHGLTPAALGRGD